MQPSLEEVLRPGWDTPVPITFSTSSTSLTRSGPHPPMHSVPSLQIFLRVVLSCYVLTYSSVTQTCAVGKVLQLP